MNASIASGVTVSFLLVCAEPLPGQAVDPTTLRPTDVVVVINQDAHYDGTYRASGISRICGKLDYMMPHRANSFVVEFPDDEPKDRKSTRLNSSHSQISYAVFCLKKKKNNNTKHNT